MATPLSGGPQSDIRIMYGVDGASRYGLTNCGTDTLPARLALLAAAGDWRKIVRPARNWIPGGWYQMELFVFPAKANWLTSTLKKSRKLIKLIEELAA